MANTNIKFQVLAFLNLLRLSRVVKTVSSCPYRFRC
ncbi:hypothetical protein LINGRAHAP2_LOCUS36526 [Linum grandiflorum]